MEEVFKVIFELDAKGEGVFEEINKVQSKYKEINVELKKQDAIMDSLRVKEAQILEARKKAQSPNAVAKYNQELTKTRKEIEATDASIKKLAASEGKLEKQNNSLNASIDKAFNAAKLKAMDSAVKDLQDEFKNTEKPIEGVSNRFTSLRKDLKAAKGELADALNTGDQKAIDEASQKVGKLKDELDDVNQAASQFASGSKFQQIGNIFGDLSQQLISMDFEGAENRSRALLSTTRSLTFKEALGGIKQLGNTLLNVGKSLLLNPIFLLGATITLIISNFDKLKSMGGLVGGFFRGISQAIDGTVHALQFLSDAIFQTSFELERLNKAKIDKLAANLLDNVKVIDRYIKAVKASGKETEGAEIRKQQVIAENSRKQLQLLDQVTKANGFASDEQIKQRQELVDAILDAENETYVIQQESNKRKHDQAKKYADDVSKIFDDLNKKLKEEQNKTISFNIEASVPNDSIAKINALFELRKKLEDEAFKETEKNALKDLKSAKDISKAKGLLLQIQNQESLNRINDYNKAIVDLELDNGRKLIDVNKANALKLIDASNQTESQKINQRTTIEEAGYSASISLLQQNIAKRKALGYDVVALEKELNDLKFANDVFLLEQEKALLTANFNQATLGLDFAKAHANAELQLKNATNSKKLYADAKYERDRLAIIQQAYGEESTQAQEQQDKIKLLEKEANKQRILEYVSYFETIVNAAVSATNQILSAKIKELDAQTRIQEQRVQDAKDIAKDGNAEMLEEEKKRLSDLNKEKEKYVRQQQALAVIELIANTAIAVSKAAAEGGAFAGITIAAALIALVAGLASARATASQAAFFDGGMYDPNHEGYTGDGNIREASSKFRDKPYTSHRQEFIFNNEKTRRYRNIFDGVHKGNIDLNEWQIKVKGFDMLTQHAALNTSGALNYINPIVNNNIEVTQLKSQMDELIWAVRQIPRTDLIVDEDGWRKRQLSAIQRDNFIKNNLG